MDTHLIPSSVAHLACLLFTLSRELLECGLLESIFHRAMQELQQINMFHKLSQLMKEKKSGCAVWVTASHLKKEGKQIPGMQFLRLPKQSYNHFRLEKTLKMIKSDCQCLQERQTSPHLSSGKSMLVFTLQVSLLILSFTNGLGEIPLLQQNPFQL